jgi:hypothetical protein
MIHHQLLWDIYEFLSNNTDMWGSQDAQRLCGIADTIIELYDRPIDVVDLTGVESGGDAGGANTGDDSGIIE